MWLLLYVYSTCRLYRPYKYSKLQKKYNIFIVNESFIAKKARYLRDSRVE